MRGRCAKHVHDASSDSARRRSRGKLNLPAVLPRGDDAIQQEVRRLIGDVLTLADAGLRVDAGVVGLLGRTCGRREADAIRRAVAGVPGVIAVRGQIECDEQSDRT
jgi:osmotically-inducible protein OsmY